MSASATNIHFHGTNVAPVCGQDEVVHTLVQPGQSFDYNVQIPHNEPPGLYWYHPHPHGFSEGQVQGGATGALIVEGLQNVDPALAGLTERTFVIRDQVLPASEANDPNIPAWDLSINIVPVTYPELHPGSDPDESWAAGVVARGEHRRRHHPEPAVRGQRNAAGDAGGGNRRISHCFRAAAARHRESETSILLAPGARAEFVVTTPNGGRPGAIDHPVLEYRARTVISIPTRPIANIVSQSGIESSRQPRTVAVA